MAQKYITRSSFEAYEKRYNSLSTDSDHGKTVSLKRATILAKFPFSIMTLTAIDDIDFANFWLWNKFGPCNGSCHQSTSAFKACDVHVYHDHVGSWCCHFFAKTGYDFGFNEWYFDNKPSLILFKKFITKFNKDKNPVINNY